MMAKRRAYRAHPPPGAQGAEWSMPRTLLMPDTGRDGAPPGAARGAAGRRIAPVAGGGGCGLARQCRGWRARAATDAP